MTKPGNPALPLKFSPDALVQGWTGLVLTTQSDSVTDFGPVLQAQFFDAVQLAGQAPIRAPFVEGIQHQVAPLGPVELLNELGRRVVDYGGFAALFDLAQYLPDGVRFAASGVSHEQDVARFELARNAEAGSARDKPPPLPAGVLIGTATHEGEDARSQFAVEEMIVEAMTTSEIEGEFLNRASVQSSIQRQLGLKVEERRIAPAEQGISELMVSLYRSIREPLTADMLFGMHRMVMSGRRDLRDIGRFRTSKEPMQVVSGAIYAPKVHFEAPPSSRVSSEMESFGSWFNRFAPDGPEPLPALTRAGLAHLRFECIHPSEDGNGRVGRAIAEKALIQGFTPAILIALASTILSHQRSYYDALGTC